jgi:hypothetical protein
MVGYCTCEKQDLAVTVRIDGDPGKHESTVSVTCYACRRPVFIELSALVESEDIPMRLSSGVEGGGINYTLKPEGGR